MGTSNEMDESSVACSKIPTAVGVGEDLVAFPLLFNRQVDLTPDRIAIVHEDRELTYAELRQLAGSFSSDLIESGVCLGDHVGLCLDRSPEAIAAMLGVMGMGATFVPLDPEYPADRLAFMIDDAMITTIVADPKHRMMLETNVDRPIKWIEGDIRENVSQVPLPSVDTLCELAPDAIAYVMYTSGSTGKPKGVQIDHAALSTYCFADIDIYQVVPGDRTLQFSTLNFDIAIEEIFPPLLCGSCVVVRPSERSSQRNELSATVDDFQVTAIHLATAYWHQWVDLMVATGDRVPASIRLMIVTGEKVSVQHYRRWQSICDHEVLWCNAYGPTEATVSATVFIPDAAFDAPNMPIGKPMKRYEALILDDELREVEPGQTGQLFIGGPALASGYLNRPELTEKAFLQLPAQEHSAGQRLYRTGDLARWLPDGNIDFGGRIDHQIKLGSYRIEPGEIEAALDQHPEVLESLVSYDEIDGKKFLIAYIASGRWAPNPGDLAEFLRDRLPPYMIPARYALMPEFPQTINGKIDRDRLDPSTSLVARDENYLPPRNDMERKLAALWQDVLNVPQVGIHDDFFLLGGSSLLVTQIVARLTVDLDIELPVRDFFANPTVATAASHIMNMTGESGAQQDDDDARTQRRGQLPSVDAQYFASGDEQLLGVLYRPVRNSRNHTVLMCHAYGHEYTRSFRNVQQLAIQLCQAGFDVLRFDYAGTGQSTGMCEQATFEFLQDNIAAAARFATQLTNPERISAVGIRLGATALAGSSLSGLEHLILWDPVISGERFVSDLEHFHHTAMTDLTRFNQVRSSGSIDQLFGHKTNEQQRLSFQNASLVEVQKCKAIHCSTVTSDGYLDQEGKIGQEHFTGNVIQTSDMIRWHDAAYTESAFSSPESFRVILEILSEDAQ